MRIIKIIFGILVTPLVLFGFALMMARFFAFHADIKNGEDYAFAYNLTFPMVFIIAVVFSLCALVILSMVTAKWGSETVKMKTRRIMPVLAIVFLAVPCALAIPATFLKQTYFKTWASTYGYEYCAQQRGGNKSSTILLFAKTPELCQDFHARNIKVKDFYKEIGRNL